MKQRLETFSTKEDKIKIEELWNDFNQQIKVEINEIVDNLEEVIGKSNSKIIKDILTNLCTLNNIFEERKEIDRNQSGLYMIKELVHYFDASGSYTKLKLVRDTFGERET